MPRAPTLPTFRSLLLEELHVRLPGAEALSLMLHRHLEETASVSQHAHPWCQAIVYLTGTGRQWVEGEDHEVVPGSLVVLPPRVRHAFRRTSPQRPLCLLVDFRWDRSRRAEAAVRKLAPAELARLRADLSELMRWEGGGRGAGSGRLRHLQSAAAVLRVLAVALESAGWVEPPPRVTALHRGAAPLADWLASAPLDTPTTELARRSGYHRDHLNRLVRRDTGRTLGQLRSDRRLDEARRLLDAGWKVGAVASAVGIDDQNYFARWFRKTTGDTPTAYRARSHALDE